ncbi:MAG TPA: hypothetical protein RMF84_02725, partial [Polyangiaceae bacterium LLY-WYZ-14_1]|nr:hypothetical protein [Polyangiaceae bacterium LLY-WYZ-14_1]
MDDFELAACLCAFLGLGGTFGGAGVLFGMSQLRGRLRELEGRLERTESALAVLRRDGSQPEA